MKNNLVVAIILLLTACGDGSSVSSDPALTQMLETQWAEYAATVPQSAGGIALYIRTPKGDYFASTGMENVSPDTHFRAASNTKTFTSAAIMLLHQEGRLNIDDLITSNIPGTDEPYVPDTTDYDVPYKDLITIRQLLSHRAGVFDIGNDIIPPTCDVPYAGEYYTLYVRRQDDNHTFSTDELVGAVARCNLSYFKPGEDYHYSNTGYSILVKIIERVSGLSYAEFLEQRLFAPNDLFETTAPSQGNDRAIPEPTVPGYYLLDGQFHSIDNDNMSENVGEGNLISTPVDLARWIRRLTTGQAGLSADSVSQMTECASHFSDTACYGFGLMIANGAQTGIGHNGAHFGYMSLMLHDPVKDITSVLFANFLDSDNPASEQQLFGKVWLDAYKLLGY